jgi:hypothetical protein
MEIKLNKIKLNFTKIKDIRVAVMNIFNTLEVKISKLKVLTNDFIKNNHDTLFVFGLDSFKFQSKLIDFEYTDMQKYFSALNNRMYCEYYKLYKIVFDYIDTTIGQNKTLEMIKSNSKFPIYKDLEPYKQYSFDTIEEVHKTIILLLTGIHEYIVLKDSELDTFKMKQYSGFNINNFVNTFDFNIIIVKQKLTLFISYLEFFHNIHTKHFKRFSKKMKLMDDHINDDIQFDDSPRRKSSKDFDDSSSENSSIVSSYSDSVNTNKPIVPEPHHKMAPRKSFLKKGVDTVMNGLKILGQKPKPIVDLTTNNNINLVISETNNPTSTELNEVNIASISRERSETISAQLNNDPKLVSKMFDELTKTFDDDEKVLKRSPKKSVKKVVQVEEKEEIEVQVQEKEKEEVQVEEKEEVQVQEKEEVQVQEKEIEVQVQEKEEIEFLIEEKEKEVEEEQVQTEEQVEEIENEYLETLDIAENQTTNTNTNTNTNKKKRKGKKK